MNILQSIWITAQTTIGVVLYENDVNEQQGVISAVDGFNEESDRQHVADYGAKLSFAQAKGFFPDIKEENYKGR